MAKRLEGKTALVTGAGRGIGKAIALRLAADGAEVIVNYARDAASAASVVATIAQNNGSAVAVQADIGDLSDVQRLAAASVARYGKVDILIHNAGMRGGHPRLEAITPDAFDAMFNLHAKGPLFLTQTLVRSMPDNGRIISISSASTARKIPGLGLYTGSKSAVEAFTRVWAAELAPRGITVNTVSPGAVQTDLLSENTEEFTRHLLSLIPMGRLGLPEDIADVCAFVASEEARWLTGINITATGGA